MKKLFGALLAIVFCATSATAKIPDPTPANPLPVSLGGTAGNNATSAATNLGVEKQFPVAAYGALGVAADDCPNIQAAINAAQAYAIANGAGGGATVTASGKVYNCLTGITYDPQLISIHWNNSKLNAVNMTTSTNTVGNYIVRFLPTGQTGYPNQRSVFENLYIMGPGKNSGIDMLGFVGYATGIPSSVVVRNVVQGSGGSGGARYGAAIMAHGYLITFYNTILSNNQIGLYLPASQADSDENIAYFAGVIGQNDVGVQMDNVIAADVHVDSTSFDFNAINVIVNQGTYHSINAHYEGNSLSGGNPLFKAANCSGCSILLNGGSILMDAAGPFTGNGIFQADGSGTIQLDHVFMNNLNTSNNTLATGTGSISITNSMGFNNPGGGRGLLNNMVNGQNSNQNLFADGDFESGKTFADDIFIYNDTATITNPYVGTNISLSNSTNYAYTGTRSLKATKVGGSGTSAGFYVAAPFPKVQIPIGILQINKPGSQTGTLTVCTAWLRVTVIGGVPVATRQTLLGCGPFNYGTGASGWQSYQVAFTPPWKAPTWATHFAWSFNMDAMNAGDIYVDAVNLGSL